MGNLYEDSINYYFSKCPRCKKEHSNIIIKPSSLPTSTLNICNYECQCPSTGVSILLLIQEEETTSDLSKSYFSFKFPIVAMLKRAESYQLFLSKSKFEVTNVKSIYSNRFTNSNLKYFSK